MSKSVRRLGRGLDSLVSDLRGELQRLESPPTSPTESTAADRGGVAEHGATTAMLPIDALSPNPLQPREEVESANIESLAESIRQNGLIQPIVVRAGRSGYEIVAGQRRWLAAKSLGMTQVPVVLREATDEEMLVLALVENLQREDLNAIDRANAYHQFVVRFNIRPEEVAARLGEDRTTVVNYLRLLDLPEGIQTLVGQSKLTMGHARCLAGVSDDRERAQLASLVVERDLSVRALEETIRQRRGKRSTAFTAVGNKTAPHSAHIADLERRFEGIVKTKVRICEGKRKGRGRIVIEYYSLDDFDRIAGLFGMKYE